MKALTVKLSLCCFLIVVVTVKSVPVSVSVNRGKTIYPPSYNGPVIGILTQKTYGDMKKYGHTYMAASYVKFLEMAGAQVIPVSESLVENAEELNRTLHSINGMLIPGGAQIFPNSRFYKAAKYIYDWTVSKNRNGTHFPLWGTCLGFEAILYAEANAHLESDSEIRFSCSAHMPNNLTLQDGAQNSRLLQSLDSALYQALQTENVVYNSHSWCIGPETIDVGGALHDTFDLLGVNYDSEGKEYIALVEHKKLPIYASQFHPEKSGFEWTIYENIPHSRNAIYFMQYLANFFVNEAAQNTNKFSNPVEFYKRNINNVSPVYTALAINSTLESCYYYKD